MKISEPEIIETLSRSGYFLESRILSTLSKNKFSNFPNQSYPDGITGKAREIDIISISPRMSENLELNETLHVEIKHHLIIECFNNEQPVAFFKRPDKSPYTNYGKFFFTDIFREMKGHGSARFDFDTYTTESKRFHYNAFKSNTQYCSFSQKKANKEWMASHPDGLHETFNKIVDYSIHHSEQIGSWMKNDSAWKDGVFITLYFPVLVLQGQLIEVFEKDGSVELKSKDHLVFEYNKYTDMKSEFLIDIVTESHFESYLNKINESVQGVMDTIVTAYSGQELEELKK